MKKDLFNTDEFDEFFKKKYDEDTINPSPVLWENINQALNYEKIGSNYRSITKLKIAIVAFALALIGTIIYFEIGLQGSKSLNLHSNILSGNDSLASINRTEPQNRIIEDGHTPGQDELHKSNSEVINDKGYPINNKKVLIKTIGFIEEKSNLTSKNHQAGKATGYQSNVQNSLFINALLLNSDSGIKCLNPIRCNLDLFKHKKASEYFELIDLQNTDSPHFPIEYLAFDTKDKKHNISFEINISPQYTYRALFVNNNYLNPELDKAYFNSREMPDLNFASGLQLFYKLNSKWEVTMGIAYAKYSQKMKANSFDVQTNQYNGYHIYTSFGRNDLTISSSVPINKSDFIKSRIEYSFISIPIQAQYRLNSNYFINGGISYSFMVAQDVNWQAIDYNGDFFIETNNIYGLNSSFLSLVTGMGSNIKLKEKLSLVINPTFTMFLTSLTNKMPVNTYPFSFGLKVGFRYNL